MRIGAIQITTLSDGQVAIPPSELLDRPREDWDTRMPGALDADGLLPVNFGGFLLRTPTHTVLVDAGIGAGAAPETGIGHLPRHLADAGVDDADLTDVLLTHLHFDHVGWLSDGRSARWPAARHHCHAADWAHWVTDATPETGPGRDVFGALPAPDRLGPLADAIRRFEGDATEIVPGVTARLAPGHSPGHCVIEVASEGERALLLADATHHPIELLHDDWTSATDEDPERARRTRATLAAELLDTPTVATATHLGGNAFGRLVTENGRRRWVQAPSIE